MGDRNQRWSWSYTADITTSGSTTVTIDFRAAAGGLIIMPASATSQNIVFYAAEREDGLFRALQEISNLAVPSAVVLAVQQNKVYPFPDQCYGAAWLRLVASGSTISDVTFSFKS